ncbi:PadR family transcriptional regulator [Bacillus massiliglaciei]|uniref:PadR family transcriptional regulator n=1 Tax=Bacillus massiliglaciei TaxID=1816693 RepID=UPI000DA60C32|nr:PadR family transcriptional regulator [Bacillus massiliglaciei]
MEIHSKDDKWIVQLRKGIYELAILSLLKSQNMYGYEISKFLRVFPVLSISEGAIYPILKRMAAKEWISSYWQDPVDGPRRKYYQITIKGETVLKSRLSQYREMYDVLVYLGEGSHEKNGGDHS